MEDIRGVQVFADDVLIHSASFEDHVQLLHTILQQLRDVNMTVKLSKCTVTKEEIQFLDYRVGKGHCFCVEDKIKKIQGAPAPHTKKKVRSFLGLVRYYRRFVPNFTVVAWPLFDLVKKIRLTGGSSVRQVVPYPQTFVVQGTHLAVARPLEANHPQNRCLSERLAAVLLQEKDGNVFPVAYHSRKLKQAEKSYNTIKCELLAVVDGVRKFYFYLYGDEFVLQTRHMPLESLCTSFTAISDETAVYLWMRKCRGRLVSKA